MSAVKYSVRPLIKSVLQLLLSEYKTKGYTPQEVNSGLCGVVAEDAVFLLQEKGVYVDIKSVKPIGGIRSHTFLTHGRLCFDVEALNGVSDYRKLPYFIRAEVSRKAATRADHAD